MESKTRPQALNLPAESSPDSSSTSNPRYTPDPGSEDSDESDLELGEGELHESFRLRSRPKEKSGKTEGVQDADSDNDEDDNNAYVVGYRAGTGRRGSMSTVQSYQLYTPDEERAVVRKFDRRLVLFVALLYMLSFLDRSSMLFPTRSVAISDT